MAKRKKRDVLDEFTRVEYSFEDRRPDPKIRQMATGSAFRLLAARPTPYRMSPSEVCATGKESRVVVDGDAVTVRELLSCDLFGGRGYVSCKKEYSEDGDHRLCDEVFLIEGDEGEQFPVSDRVLESGPIITVSTRGIRDSSRDLPVLWDEADEALEELTEVLGVLDDLRGELTYYFEYLGHSEPVCWISSPQYDHPHPAVLDRDSAESSVSDLTADVGDLEASIEELSSLVEIGGILPDRGFGLLGRPTDLEDARSRIETASALVGTMRGRLSEIKDRLSALDVSFDEVRDACAGVPHVGFGDMAPEWLPEWLRHGEAGFVARAVREGRIPPVGGDHAVRLRADIAGLEASIRVLDEVRDPTTEAEAVRVLADSAASEFKEWTEAEW